jgi:transposase
VIVTVDVDIMPLAPAGRSVGVDLGIAWFLTTSDGQVIANPSSRRFG